MDVTMEYGYVTFCRPITNSWL